MPMAVKKISARKRAFTELVVLRFAAEKTREVRSIGHQTSRNHELSNGIRRGKPLLERPATDLHPICERQRVADHEQRLRLCFNGIQGGRNIGRQFDFHGGRFEPERLSGLYDFLQLQSGIGNTSITQDRKPPQIGDYFAKEFYSLADQIEIEGREAGGIASGPCQAGNQTASNWVCSQRKNNRNPRGGSLGRERWPCRPSHDQV